MTYPINDIFEGTGDLLVEHGEVVDRVFDNKLHREDIYITYGQYRYLAVYAGGMLITITRMARRNYNGQD